MDSIIEKINNSIEKYENCFGKDKDYSEFLKTYEDLKSNGLLVPKNYNLPPRDTIGKRLYQSEIK